MVLVKDALKHIDMNIACSDKVRDSYKEIFNVDRIATVHNPIDEERIRNMSLEGCEHRTSEDKIDLITVARFHRQKGLDRLIKAYSKLKDHYTLTIIGDGELRNELYTLAKELNCFEDIKWLGIQGNPYPYVRESDLFVMSSLYEGYPTMTVEALISDTPVLTTEVAGVREQIHEDEGWIVENSEEGLYGKLNELKDSKDLLIEYKKRLIDYHYDNERLMETYYSLFRG